MIALWIILMSIVASHGRKWAPICSAYIYPSGIHYVCSNRHISNQDFPDRTNYLYLDNTSIKTIKPGAFDSLNRLLKLNLSQNYISRLQSDTFAKTVMLEILDLSYNKIETLDSSLFECLVNLNVLNLNNNRIRFLPDHIFRNQGDLDELYISGNKLVTLQGNIFVSLVKLECLELNGNSFKCDCDLLSVRNWTQIHDLKVDVNCEIAQNKSLVHWSSVKFMHVCSNKTMMTYTDIPSNTSTKRSLIIAISVVLVIICIGFILAAIWWRNRSKTIYSGTAHKLKETSCENEDNATVDLDKMYAKVNKSHNKKGPTKIIVEEQSRPGSVGFYTSLKEDSLYSEAPTAISLRSGDERKQSDSQINLKNSLYESSGEYVIVKENPS